MRTIVQSWRAWQMSTTKFLMTSLPLAEWVTSAWNWMPKIGRDSWAMAAKGAVGVLAIVTKLGGRAVTWSPCDIQTCFRKHGAHCQQKLDELICEGSLDAQRRPRRCP